MAQLCVYRQLCVSSEHDPKECAGALLEDNDKRAGVSPLDRDNGESGSLVDEDKGPGSSLMHKQCSITRRQSLTLACKTVDSDDDAPDSGECHQLGQLQDPGAAQWTGELEGHLDRGASAVEIAIQV